MEPRLCWFSFCQEGQIICILFTLNWYCNTSYCTLQLHKTGWRQAWESIYKEGGDAQWGEETDMIVLLFKITHTSLLWHKDQSKHHSSYLDGAVMLFLIKNIYIYFLSSPLQSCVVKWYTVCNLLCNTFTFWVQVCLAYKILFSWILKTCTKRFICYWRKRFNFKIFKEVLSS